MQESIFENCASNLPLSFKNVDILSQMIKKKIKKDNKISSRKEYCISKNRARKIMTGGHSEIKSKPTRFHINPLLF